MTGCGGDADSSGQDDKSATGDVREAFRVSRWAGSLFKSDSSATRSTERVVTSSQAPAAASPISQAPVTVSSTTSIAASPAPGAAASLVSKPTNAGICAPTSLETRRLLPAEGAVDGASGKWMNYGAGLQWRTSLGDWIDSTGQYRGTACSAPVTITDTDTVKPVAWDVLPIVSTWKGDISTNQGILLLPTGGGTVVFSSKEGANSPQLRIDFSDGTSLIRTPTVDTYLTIYGSLGKRTDLILQSGGNGLLWFDISAADLAKSPVKATLTLTSTGQYGQTTVCAMRVGGTLANIPSVTNGLAANYPSDAGIGADPSVYFATDFSNDTWKTRIFQGFSGDPIPAVVNNSEPPTVGFKPLSGASTYAKFTVKAGDNQGSSMEYRFTDANNGGQEVGEAYLRYYLMFGTNFISDSAPLQPGKIPGLSGNTSVCGNGGRRADGSCGWSARMMYNAGPERDNPIRDQVLVGNYVYWTNQEIVYGDTWLLTNNALGSLKMGQWHCIEQRIKVNTPGVADGILENWVDGRYAFGRSDVKFRNLPPYGVAGSNLGIQKAWLNFYYGGAPTAPHDVTWYMTKLVISRARVGCMP